MSKRSKINTEIKVGSLLLGTYFIWALAWFLYSYVYLGTFSDPYFPASDIKKELFSPLEDGYLLGTDLYGRSLFQVLSAGLFYSLGIGLTISFLSAGIGIVIGYLSVVGPKSVKTLSELVTNLIFIFPSILIAILVMSLTGQSFSGLVFALVVTGWPGYARISRGETLRVMSLTYVESAKAVGVGPIRLFSKIVLPAILPFLLVHIVLGISGVIISEASLGFLGLGGSEYSWGALLSSAKTVLLEAPYMGVVLSLVMAGLIIGLNLVGDGLRDYLDPKS
jgi:peptide/nickel transport system permease protein